MSVLERWWGHKPASAQTAGTIIWESDERGGTRDDPPACWWLDSTRVGQDESKVDELILHFWTTTRLFLEPIRLFLPRLGGLRDATTSTTDLLQDDRRAAALQHILTLAAFSLLDTANTPPPHKKNPHVEWKTIWKLKATMRGRMTVLQFLVILTVKSPIHHRSLLTLPLSTYSGYEGRRQDPNGRGHCGRVRIDAALPAGSRPQTSSYSRKWVLCSTFTWRS